MVTHDGLEDPELDEMTRLLLAWFVERMALEKWLEQYPNDVMVHSKLAEIHRDPCFAGPRGGRRTGGSPPP